MTDTFYMIDVVLRMELAREEALRDRVETVGELTVITGQIRDDLKEAMRAVREITVKTGNAVRYYAHRLTTQESLIADIEGKIRRTYDELQVSQRLFSDVVRQLSMSVDTIEERIKRWCSLQEHVDELHAEIEVVVSGMASPPPGNTT